MIKAIPEGWKRQKLMEVAQPISYGVKPFEGYRTYIATADLNGHGIIGGVPVTYENRPSRADLELGNGNVIFARMKETVKVLEVLNRTEKYIFSTGFAGFRPQTDLVSGFLKQFFLNKEFNRLKDSLCTGSTQMAITSDGIEQIDILLPPLPEQHKIAAILGSVDKAIEKTRAVVEQTRSLKRAMMQELLTRGIPGRHKKFKKTPVGEIPDEWEVVRLGEVYEIQLGKMLSPKSKVGSNPKPYLANYNVRWNEIDIRKIQYMDFTVDEMNKYRLRKGDLLICEGGEIGRTAVWNEELSECYYQKALHRLRPVKDKAIPEFLLYFMMFAANKRYFNDYTGVNTIAHLPAEQLRKIRVPLPQCEEQKQIAELLQQLDNRISADAAVLDGFGRMKDALMQNLLSGQIRVCVVCS